ncbi:hypothetical protein P879_08661 [Paragonimus westermani]|uniref:Methionyl/Leucyl tRNA synthetase domain-containing protein n=1 Tax=Paragonimus westermani TaxID=34504 RepID=A0A8T0D3E0_9TREM|nr:hypothetical protein P879_08661 [Paragonimus westermani]
MKLNKLFITCPIFYVNAKPHLGHAYTLCLADAWARCCHVFGVEFPLTRLRLVFVQVKQAARLAKADPRAYCNEISPLFKTLCEANSVEINDFIRTTEERHVTAVGEFWRLLSQSGYLDQAIYSGWYSIADETFYADWELSSVATSAVSHHHPPGVANKPSYVATETGSPVDWVEESNFLFRLTAFKEPLHKWLDSGVFLTESPSQSMWREKSHVLVDTINDVSVSRPRERLDWGIPVPDHPDQVIYVWLDALVNYLTVSGFPWSSADSTSVVSWPPDFQFIGKDILRFHAVLWPALLMAVDLPLPKHLICHCHLLVDNVKMSKSRHNVLDPFEEQRKLTPNIVHAPISAADCEGLRYVLLRSALLNSDASYCRETAKQLIDTELVNCLGNLLSR